MVTFRYLEDGIEMDFELDFKLANRLFCDPMTIVSLEFEEYHEFDNVVVEAIIEQIENELLESGFPRTQEYRTLKELRDFLMSAGINMVELNPQNAEFVLPR